MNAQVENMEVGQYQEFDLQQRRLANAIRALTIDAIDVAHSGHPGLPLGMADVATVLFTQFINVDPNRLDWPDRDRFILSAGHGSMLLYAVLHLTGVQALTMDQLRGFRTLGSLTPGHPEDFLTPGVECTSGPLGQGFATAVGMALAEAMLASEFGRGLVDHYTYALVSDGDLMEGISQEALALAGHLKLNKLIVLFDDNRITIDGDLALTDSTDQLQRFAASGWRTMSIDGHKPSEIYLAIAMAKASDRPTLIACRTTIGYGAPTKAGTSKAHSEPLGIEEGQGAKAFWGWEAGPFDIPDDVREGWSESAKRGTARSAAWHLRFANSEDAVREAFTRRLNRALPANFQAEIERTKDKLARAQLVVATRKASQLFLDEMVPALDEFVSGSADLTPSNLTKAQSAKSVDANDFSGRYLHYGIREHGMAAAINGLTLHGGFRAAGGMFMAFSDYARGAIRLACIAGIPSIFICTHDSLGVGEDGPTHQPIEHLAGLRAMPNLRVFRPADAVEVVECWQLALERTSGPTVIALSRQPIIAPVRAEGGAANRCVLGAYEIVAALGEPDVSIFASGSEVAVAIDAATILQQHGIVARVVSVPSLELFLSQAPELIDALRGHARLNVAVEAAARWGWDALIGREGLFIGMSTYGASASPATLFEHFGIDAKNVAAQVVRALG